MQRIKPEPENAISRKHRVSISTGRNFFSFAFDSNWLIDQSRKVRWHVSVKVESIFKMKLLFSKMIITDSSTSGFFVWPCCHYGFFGTAATLEEGSLWNRGIFGIDVSLALLPLWYCRHSGTGAFWHCCHHSTAASLALPPLWNSGIFGTGASLALSSLWHNGLFGTASTLALQPLWKRGIFAVGDSLTQRALWHCQHSGLLGTPDTLVVTC